MVLLLSTSTSTGIRIGMSTSTGISTSGNTSTSAGTNTSVGTSTGTGTQCSRAHCALICTILHRLTMSHIDLCIF